MSKSAEYYISECKRSIDEFSALEDYEQCQHLTEIIDEMQLLLSEQSKVREQLLTLLQEKS